MKMHKLRTNPDLLSRAKEFRHPMTRAESILWGHLRDRQFGGFKFRRQYPIGPYIPDFYCAECHLIIEVDGDVHATQQEHDAARSAWFGEHSYRVIRFFNDELYHHFDAVLETILVECQTSLSLSGRGSG